MCILHLILVGILSILILSIKNRGSGRGGLLNTKNLLSILGKSYLLKFQDRICLENILFVSKSLYNLSPSIFDTWFSFSSDQHNYETSSSTQGNFMKLFYKTNRYGKYSITVSAAESWNKIQKQLKNMLLKNLSPYKIKTVVTNFYLKSY